MVSGTISYTVFRPDCPHPQESNLPTDVELDKDLASSANGTLLDQPGTRFTKSLNRKVVWETAESIHLHAGDTLVFSPSWFHRIPPQSKDATHSGVTLVATHVPKNPNPPRNFNQGGVFMLDPRGLDDKTTTKAACYKQIDLYRELSDPNLNIQEGLPRFECHASKLHGLFRDDFSDHTDAFVYNAVLHHEEL
jgi:hypothetical protein